jgi:predicted CoA-binding protein
MSASIATARATRADIDEFLARKRFAAVGLSRNPQDFTRKLIEEFERRGYEVVPVNPGASEIGGHACLTSVQEINPPVDAALLLTSPSTTDGVVRDCAAAGVTHVWMYRGGGQGAVSADAVAFCHERGMKVVAGECPFMFLPKTGFPHRVHGLVRKILGSYPR